MIEFKELSEFSRDVKKLKKFRSINSDIKKFKTALLACLVKDCNSTLPDTRQIDGLGKEVLLPIYKVRKFRCQAMKGKGSMSGIRVIYAFDKDKQIVFLMEIYSKNNKKNEDRDRIITYFKNEKNLREMLDR